MFLVFFFLLLAVEMLTTYFHIKTLLQVEAHLPPSFVPANLHSTSSKKQAIKLLPLFSHTQVQD